MIYLLNLSKEDYLKNKIENLAEIESTMTEDGKFAAKYIKYSVQHEQNK